MKVTADDPRYDEWPSRKPSARKRTQAKILADPLGYLGKRVEQRVQRQVETAAARGLRTATRAGGGLTAGALVRGGGLVAASAAILAAGYAVMDRVAKARQLKLGEQLNAISREFISTQGALARAYGVRSWGDVPSDVRARALSDYKRALATATAQAQGSALVGARAVGSYK